MDNVADKIEILSEMFEEKRDLTPLEKKEEYHGDVFLADDGVVYLEALLNDFSVDELVRVTSIAEELYEEHGKYCMIYLLCVGDVTVREMSIPSKANFTIQLLKSNTNMCDMILSIITSKLKSGELLDEEDIFLLNILPLVCDPNEKEYYRRQVFAIMNYLEL